MMRYGVWVHAWKWKHVQVSGKNEHDYSRQSGTISHWNMDRNYLQMALQETTKASN
jgi:hypothetical protein